VLVYSGDFPDPQIIRVGADYYAYATQSGGLNVQVMRSTTLLSWEHLGEAMPVVPGWSRPGFTWSPAVLQRGDRFVMYVTVRVAAHQRQAIAMAVADHPAGPFAPVGDGPLVFQASRGGSIDPDPFVDADGHAYLVWKSDGELVNSPSAVWVRELADDGLGFTRRLVPWCQEHRLLQRGAPWEGPLIEAPCIRRDDDRYFLFYSAGRWTDATYGIGYALGTAADSAFTKVTTDGPWLGTGPDAAGPGGQCVVEDAEGGVWLGYHAWDPAAVGYEHHGARRLYVDRLELGPDGPCLSPVMTSG
jgi:beta-xylosidase